MHSDPGKEREIKISVLNWLITQIASDDIIMSELRFSDGRRRADIAIATPKELVGIEIKGARDNVRTLEAQLKDYEDYFHKVIVAFDEKHEIAVRAIASRKVGLVKSSNGTLQVIRNPTGRNELEKRFSASWITSKELHTLLSTPGRQFDVAQLRRRLQDQNSRSDLNRYAIASVRSRNLKRHQDFIQELGKIITLDDLRMLTIESKINVREVTEFDKLYKSGGSSIN